jgi:hypothetical protein
MLITCLKPNLTRAQASRVLKGPWRELRRGPLRLVMEFYIPYQLFQVRVINGRKAFDRLLAIDAATGRLDLYGFDAPLAGADRLLIETERVAPSGISEARALEILEERVKREVLMRGFFALKRLRIEGWHLEKLHIPYWVGIYGRDEQAGLEVVDAVRGRLEGAKLREVVTAWFHSEAQPPAG